MIVTMIKSPRDNGKTKVEHLYTGPQDTEVVEGMIECDSEVSALGYGMIDLNIAIYSASFARSFYLYDGDQLEDIVRTILNKPIVL